MLRADRRLHRSDPETAARPAQGEAAAARCDASLVDGMSFVLWLNDLPLWASAIVIVGSMLVLALGGMAVTRSFFEEGQLELNNFIGGFQYLFISQVLAGFLTFLLYGVYQRYDHVRTDIGIEVNALESLDRLAAGFPIGTRDALRRTLRDYAADVVKVEWPELRNRTIDVLAAAPLTTLYYTYAAVEPASRKQQEILRYSRDLLAVIQEMRAVRAQRASGSLPVLLWAATASAVIITVIFPWVFGTPNPRALAAMSALSVLLVTSVVLVVLRLSYPFNGGGGVSPEPYLAFIGEVRGRGG
jgi:hypothetical protein